MKLHAAIAALLMSVSAIAFAEKPVAAPAAPVIVSEDVQNKLDDIQIQLGLCLKNSPSALGIKLCNEDAEAKRKLATDGVASGPQKKELVQPAVVAEAVPAPFIESSVPGPYISFSAGSRPQNSFTTTLR